MYEWLYWHIFTTNGSHTKPDFEQEQGKKNTFESVSLTGPFTVTALYAVG